jgi:hypothetical protein
MKNWVCIYSTKNIPQANIIQGMLNDNNIPAQLLNKLDSSYLSFGEIEIYVPKEFKTLAESVLNKTLMN